MAQIGVESTFPWNQMKEVTVDGQSMVFIPKIYIRNTPLPASSKYAGKVAYMFTDKPTEGYHLAPSFYTDGKENETGIQVSAYIASKDSSGKAASIAGATPWTNIAYTAVDTAARTRNLGTGEQAGWRPYNIYDHHLLARLMLFEAGSADVQTIIGGSSTANGVTWHGIHDVWGGTSYGFWIYGLTTTGSGGAIMVLDNKENNSMVDTQIVMSNGGCVVTLLDNVGSNYDLGDLFLSKTVTSTEASGTLGDWQWLGGGVAFYTGWGSSSDYGPFYLDPRQQSLTHASLGFRLARAC